MPQSDYDREAEAEIERWQRGDESLLRALFDAAMRPVDWLADRAATPEMLTQFDAGVEKFVGLLNDASQWTFTDAGILNDAAKHGVAVDDVEALRNVPLEQLDPIARAQFDQNAVLAAFQGGGAGLGGIVLIAADLPVLFTLNLRLIQQVAGTYGFSLRDTEFAPLVLAVFNAAASGQPAARHQALREINVAAASLAHGHPYNGHVRGTFSAQNRHVPREIAKNLLGRKLGQMIPIAGAAVGAGVNYWFTTQTAETAYMLFRALHLECRARA
ncbi:MAG: EcsC family protein [Pseudomonadota bacterium]